MNSVAHTKAVWTTGIHWRWIPELIKPAFDWDDANITHIARHRVTPAEVEQILSGASVGAKRGIWSWARQSRGG
jgi:hypothetical protein